MGDETRIWRHYRREDMLRAKKHRRTSVRLFCESESCVKGGGLRDEKARKTKRGRAQQFFMESWKQRSGGQAGGRASQRGREGGRRGRGLSAAAASQRPVWRSAG